MTAKVLPMKPREVGEPVWTVTVGVDFVVHAKDEEHAKERIESLCRQDEQSWASDDEREPMVKHVSPPPWLKRIALSAVHCDHAHVQDGAPEEDPLAPYVQDEHLDTIDDHDDEISHDEEERAKTVGPSLFPESGHGRGQPDDDDDSGDDDFDEGGAWGPVDDEDN